MRYGIRKANSIALMTMIRDSAIYFKQKAFYRQHAFQISNFKNKKVQKRAAERNSPMAQSLQELDEPSQETALITTPSPVHGSPSKSRLLPPNPSKDPARVPNTDHAAAQAAMRSLMHQLNSRSRLVFGREGGFNRKKRSTSEATPAIMAFQKKSAARGYVSEK